jgi:transposase
MLQVTPQMRILVAVEPADFRKGIDGLAGLCRQALGRDPFSGCVFVFRNRRRTAIKLLCYDGQGFWLCQKRMSKAKFRWWPSSRSSVSTSLEAHQLPVLLSGGDGTAAAGAPTWRRVAPRD